jgi:hypothetical protein
MLSKRCKFRFTDVSVCVCACVQVHQGVLLECVCSERKKKTHFLDVVALRQYVADGAFECSGRREELAKRKTEKKEQKTIIGE